MKNAGHAMHTIQTSHPRWVFRFMPYAGAVMLGTYRLSNAKAERELGWVPTARTYREGILRLVQALGTRG